MIDRRLHVHEVCITKIVYQTILLVYDFIQMCRYVVMDAPFKDFQTANSIDRVKPATEVESKILGCSRKYTYPFVRVYNVVFKGKQGGVSRLVFPHERRPDVGRQSEWLVRKQEPHPHTTSASRCVVPEVHQRIGYPETSWTTAIQNPVMLCCF